jgi:hypothetical protein
MSELLHTVSAMTNLDSYVTQTVTSDPGAFADLVAALPGDVGSLQAASTQLVFHYRGGGDWAEHGIAPERIGEVDLRYADALLGRLVELADQPLDAPRESAQKLVGCCRDYTLLLVSMARLHGIPARGRVGFAGYFAPGWWIDHVVAEIWDADQSRWKLVEAQLPAGFVDAVTGQPLAVLDVPRDRFLTGPGAWQRARAGEVDPETFVVAPDLYEPPLRSWPYLRHNLVVDLAALGGHDMILWDDWGILESRFSTDDLPLLDELATTTVDPEAVDPDVVAEWLRHDAVRIPDSVTSYSPATGPGQVRLRDGVPT